MKHPLNELRSEIYTVTPDLADIWLREHNKYNRPLVQNYVREIAQTMLRGEFATLAHGIVFGKSGRLLDGQHRLQAIVLSGVTIPLYVTTNEDDEKFPLYDQGMARSREFATGYDSIHTSVANQVRLLLETRHRASGRPQITMIHAICVQIEPKLAMLNATVRHANWGAAPARTAAVLRLFAGRDVGYVIEQYNALVTKDYGVMSPSVQGLQRHIEGRPTARSGNLKVELMCRTFRALDPKQRDTPRSILKDTAPPMAQMREIARVHIPAAVPSQNVNATLLKTQQPPEPPVVKSPPPPHIRKPKDRPGLH